MVVAPSAGRFVSRRQRAVGRFLLRLLPYLSLIALALSSGLRATAQAVPFAPGAFQSLYTAVDSRGFSTHMPPQFVAPLGMHVKDALPCRTVMGGDGRSIFSFQYHSHQYLIVRLTSGTDRWQYLVNDAGNLIVALHATAPGGSHTVSWHSLTPSDAQPLVTAEEGFWVRWAIDWPLVPR
jgi:hypothetical protein